MEWLNLHSSVLDSPEVVGAEPTDRGTWLMLERYCIGQENCGVISGCLNWKDRKWQQLAKVTLAEVKRESDLWTWCGNDLHVWGYPADKELQVRNKREIAKTNGRTGGRPKNNPDETKLGFQNKPSLVISGKAEGEGKDKGRIREGEGASSTAQSSDDPPNPQMAEEPASLPEVVPTGRRFPDHAILMARIGSLRPEWAKPSLWGANELRELHGALGQLYELTDNDWGLLHRFLAANVEKAAGYWQPRNRSKFCETFADVLSSAIRWQGKRRVDTIPSTPPAPIQPRAVISREEMKRMMQP